MPKRPDQVLPVDVLAGTRPHDVDVLFTSFSRASPMRLGHPRPVAQIQPKVKHSSSPAWLGSASGASLGDKLYALWRLEAGPPRGPAFAPAAGHAEGPIRTVVEP